jgi:hypothetical protein
LQTVDSEAFTLKDFHHCPFHLLGKTCLRSSQILFISIPLPT